MTEKDTISNVGNFFAAVQKFEIRPSQLNTISSELKKVNFTRPLIYVTISLVTHSRNIFVSHIQCECLK